MGEGGGTSQLLNYIFSLKISLEVDSNRSVNIGIGRLNKTFE